MVPLLWFSANLRAGVVHFNWMGGPQNGYCFPRSQSRACKHVFEPNMQLRSCIIFSCRCWPTGVIAFFLLGLTWSSHSMCLFMTDFYLDFKVFFGQWRQIMWLHMRTIMGSSRNYHSPAAQWKFFGQLSGLPSLPRFSTILIHLLFTEFISGLVLCICQVAQCLLFLCDQRTSMEPHHQYLCPHHLRSEVLLIIMPIQ